MNLFADIEKTAVISDCGLYRYSLTRQWDESLPRMLWVMLNPSRADADVDDPTIRRCVGFAKAWGYGSIEVVNLFAFRATNPADMFSAPFPVGECNDYHIRQAAESASLIVVAWGAGGIHMNRDREVLPLLKDPYCLAVVQNGSPGHPLYQPSAASLFRYEGRS